MSGRITSSRSSFTLVEVAVALGVASVVVYGAIAGVRFFARPARQGDLTIDRVQDLQLGAEQLDRDLREARQIIYPKFGDPPSRILYFRVFEGGIVVYYYNPTRRQLRCARFDIGGLPTEARRPPVSDLDAAYFWVGADGLVSWGLFGPSKVLMGSAKRKNQ